jgi:hypothetical protein
MRQVQGLLLLLTYVRTSISISAFDTILHTRPAQPAMVHSCAVCAVSMWRSSSGVKRGLSAQGRRRRVRPSPPILFATTVKHLGLGRRLVTSTCLEDFTTPLRSVAVPLAFSKILWFCHGKHFPMISCPLYLTRDAIARLPWAG